MVALLLLPALLAAAAALPAGAASPQPPLLTGAAVVFVGRVQHAADGTTMFDMNGVEVKATVTGTTGLFVSMSQVQKVEPNVFQVSAVAVGGRPGRFASPTTHPLRQVSAAPPCEKAFNADKVGRHGHGRSG